VPSVTGEAPESGSRIRRRPARLSTLRAPAWFSRDGMPVLMNIDVQRIWQDASRRLRRLLNEDTYDRWIAGIVPLAVDGEVVRLGVSNDTFCEWLRNNYRDVIEDALDEAAGRRFSVAFESGHEPELIVREEKRRERASRPSKSPAMESATPTCLSQYNHRFTFDTFVVGECNKFAYAACRGVAGAPGRAYNPLFIYGATGLGKTHLLQAIAQDVISRRKRVRIEYLTSEEFANRFIAALMERKLPAFRKHYRNVDLLLIDDVHFFQGKEQFQEEFFHTFNALYNLHRQIVLTSDRPPAEIGGLEKRLVSRFEWGLTTEVLPPDLETRIAFLKKKQQEHAQHLPDEILMFVAERIRSNFRRLEGALIRLVSYISMSGGPLSVEQAEALLRPILEEEVAAEITVEKIQKVVADFFDIRVADILGKRRPQNIALPRQVAMYLSRRLTGLSTPAIGERFNRNHGTVLHAVSAVQARMNRDPSFRHQVGQLERRIRGF